MFSIKHRRENVMLRAQYRSWFSTVCLLQVRMFVVVLHHMWLTCCVALGCPLWTNGPSRTCLQRVSFISVHVRGRLMLCTLFGARHSMNACLLHNRLFGAMLQNMWTCCVALGCRLWTNGHSSLCLQQVSVQHYASPRTCHASCTI